ncbi:hypothetical protein TanjilG_12080 [Lupinus angustifolius]|uniref:Lipoxygenase n=1 Tax=Lupinus angustifolius TaxID=3871 RepID=A0A394DQS6_LUPAN|nr:PREDICTED: linoleate 13S-lipoxygenase 3-1, chloroplastic-like [Lupinus angustifolius]OIW21821.1 hypothetical protein TanjilG_12080 [Lupinus angustifolius]
MALCNESIGSSFIERSSTRIHLQQKQNLFSGRPGFVPLRNRRVVRLRKVAKFPVAALSTNLVKSSSSSSSVPVEKPVKFKVRAVVIVRNKINEDLTELLVKQLDAIADSFGNNVVLELLSIDIDPKTRAPKKTNEAVLKGWSTKSNGKAERVDYTAEFVVDSSFGVPGAITVTNRHQQEFFLETITIEGFPSGAVHFPCNSWVQARKDLPGKRIFFSNKSYLPGDTPAGLKYFREKELRNLRGDGKGFRNLSDRIYDYDTYNDLGNPDLGNEFARPTVGGSEKHPYPRRCRTGRGPMDSDNTAEIRVEKPLPMYVPRDERFEECKQYTFATKRLKGVLHILIPSLMSSLSAKNDDFNELADVESLYTEGLLIKLGLEDDFLKNLPLPKMFSQAQKSSQGILKYDMPKILTKDKFAWLRDDEFAREAIAGVNPSSIERLKVFPPVSNLDPEIYGPVDSALKEEHILSQLNGMTVQQALDENKLFMIDYHDIYLPFIERINALDGRKSYATRAIFFLTQNCTLKPVAIELSLPPAGPSYQSKRVVTPPQDATSNWIWMLAKAHFCSNDAGAHQLAHHWLRTHACMEPFILAAHRQLSAMHPIYKLLDPHMRYTLEINALARQSLISVDGVVESCFTVGRYAMELSSSVYKSAWRFDMDGLPADLVRRGMAVPDTTQPHGLKLLIEDYPYAADGLLIWSAIENWVSKYVNHYYTDSSMVSDDKELQGWYSETINVGHADLRDASWWPKLNTNEDLIYILTTFIWNVSAFHAALNFGQYPYGGFVPNRPPMMRRLIPEESDPEYGNLIADPQKFFLHSLPSVLQASKYMAVVDTLSTHSPDEEYLGERQQQSTWSDDPEIIEAFYEFSAEIGRIEKVIDGRNRDTNLRNRCGAGVLPYELLAPSSDIGVTCRGVPNSVST